MKIEEDIIAGRERILAESEISLLLDTYDDIFSDFDPRKYDHRALSHDLLIEAKNAALDKEGVLELRFLIPKAQRNVDTENTIKRRLRDHFVKHHHQQLQEHKRLTKEGFLLIGIGFIMMFLAIILYSELIPLPHFVNAFFIVVTEPAGWFLFWIGGEKLVYGRRDILPELEFYRKMEHVNILFISY